MTSVEITDQGRVKTDLPKGRVICLLWEREIAVLDKGSKDR